MNAFFSRCLLVSFKISGIAIRKKTLEKTLGPVSSRFDISLVIQWDVSLGFAVVGSLFVMLLKSAHAGCERHRVHDKQVGCLMGGQSRAAS
jgi:hypothetical protein